MSTRIVQRIEEIKQRRYDTRPIVPSNLCDLVLFEVECVCDCMQYKIGDVLQITADSSTFVNRWLTSSGNGKPCAKSAANTAFWYYEGFPGSFLPPRSPREV